MTTSNSSFLKNSISTKFNPDTLIIPVTNTKHLGNHVFPIYQNINEENFKNHILTESSKSHPKSNLKHPKTERARLPSKYSRRGKNSVGNMISEMPMGANTNHHYGVFFNTNSSVKKSKDGSIKDRKKTTKNFKHMRKMCAEKKIDTFGKYFHTHRHNM